MKHQTPRTVRFWAFNPETLDWVRVALRDGESVTLGGHTRATDEGWSVCGDTYAREGNRIELSAWSDGRDCDGRLSRCWGGEWTVGGPMRTVPDGYEVPDFDEVSASQRDEYAELAGY